MVKHFPEGATFTKLHKQSEMKKTTFCSALECAKAKGWIVGGGERGKRYNLDPQGSWKNSEQGSVQLVHPNRGVKPTEPIDLSSNEPTSN